MSEKPARMWTVMSNEQRIITIIQSYDQDIACIVLHVWLNWSSMFRFSDKALPDRDWGPSSKGERAWGIKPLTSKYDKFQHHLCSFFLDYLVNISPGARNARRGQSRADSRGKKHLNINCLSKSPKVIIHTEKLKKYLKLFWSLSEAAQCILLL